jgi:dTMP kinase
MSAHFIVLEGIDGSGTTTQTQLLCEELRRRHPAREIIQTREPWDTMLTKRIRSWLAMKNPPWAAVLHAFVLDRHIHLLELVRPALDRGAIVVCDRYKLSTLVYQPMHNDRELVQQLCDADSVLDPSMYVLLDIDPQLAAVRVASRSATKDVYERNLELQENLAQQYRKVLQDEQEITGTPCEHLRVERRSILEVHEMVMEAVSDCLGV